MTGTMAWFVLALALPAAEASPDAAAASRQLDAILAAGMSEVQLAPAPRCDDATFARRVWLDVAGRIPPAQAVEKHLASTSQQKRSELIGELLQSRESANHWARLWAEYYLDARPFDQQTYNGRLLQRYLYDAFRQNTSYRQVAREILAGDGTSDISGPANFLLRYEANPQMLAGAVSRKFLSVTLQCAECHDHPHAAWKQDDFWGLAAFFARLRRMNPAEEPEGDTFAVVLERSRGELSIPDYKAQPKEDGTRPTRIIYPRTPSGPIDISASRRDALIDWLTSAQNPYFARHFVNQTWKQLFGDQLVPTLDETNPTSSSGDTSVLTRRKVLDHLAADFAASDYDVRRLLSVILHSDAYQRSAGSATESADLPELLAKREAVEHKHLARFPMRPLTGDQLYLSIAQATGFYGDDQSVRLGAVTDEDFATDLPANYFSSQPQSLPRSVAMLNGDYIRGAADAMATSATRIYGNTPGARHVQWMFVSALGRSPSADEMELMLDLAARQDGGLADVAWTLLNSAEFNLNH
jgi:hypothetical protein